jgi:hypothetical protein
VIDLIDLKAAKSSNLAEPANIPPPMRRSQRHRDSLQNSDKDTDIPMNYE